MKVNFDASFKELRKVLDGPLRKQTPPAEPGKFANLISSLRAVDEKTPAKTSDVSTLKVAEHLQEPENPMPMASLRAESPGLGLPRLNLLESGPEEHLPVNEPANSVKTPSVLSARRISNSSSSLDKVSAIFGEAGNKHGIDPALGAAVAKAESSFNPTAVSTDGHKSKGLMQLLDSTGKDMLGKLGMKDEYAPFDPDQNVELGVGYLRYLHDLFSKPTELPRFGTTKAAANSASLEKLAVAAFNAGEGRVTSAQERAERAGKNPAEYEHVEKYLPETTQEYVSRVMEFKEALKGEFES